MTMILDEATCIVMEEDAGSPFTCGACNQALSPSVERFLVRSNMGASCKCDCGELLQIEYIDVKVIPSSAQFLDAEKTRQTVWYHSTDVENWDEEILKPKPSTVCGIGDGIMSVPYIHVGTLDAAMERFSDRKLSSGWLYEIRLKDDAVLADLVYADLSDWDYWVREGYFESDTQCHSLRYINRWESVGSISMLLDPRMMEVVKVSALNN